MHFWLGKRLPLGTRAGVVFGPDDFRRMSGATSASARPPSFVYVIRAVGHDKVKVGITADPNARLATLQTASAFPLEIAYVAAVKSNNASAIEQGAHATMNAYRREGEWFDVPVEMAVAAISAASFRLNDPVVHVPTNLVASVVDGANQGASQPRMSFAMMAVRTAATLILMMIGITAAVVFSALWH